MRVKLVEAFASGIPVVSTRIGAEGLAGDGDSICALADDAAAFADRIVELFEAPERAETLAFRARQHVVANRDMKRMTRRLEQSYRAVVTEKRATALIEPAPLSLSGRVSGG
jgi:glycosyltransferase involved in cell wall biosynthesis